MDAAEAARRLLGRTAITVGPLARGDLSRVYRLTFDDGGALIAKQAPTAAAEACMLEAIRATGVPVPEVRGAEDEWLLMEEVEAGGSLAAAWPDLAHLLTRLHVPTRAGYGWPTDHAFGGVRVDNRASADWPAFWAERRLRCHLPYVRADLARRIERLADRLPEFLPRHPAAALLHGDLWGGNILVSTNRVAALIDPACYHGDREVDIAMLTLFDRPPRSFFDALGLEGGWERRLPIYRLSPLIVHLRLFGDSYAQAVETALASVEC